MSYNLSGDGLYNSLVEPIYYIVSTGPETNWTALGTIANLALAGLTLITTICVLWAGMSAHRSAKAATESLALSQDSAKRQLRAYLVADSGSVTGREIKGRSDCVYVKVVMANTGQTPASNIKCLILGTETPNRDIGAGRLIEFEFAQVRELSSIPTPISVDFSYTDCFGQPHSASISFIVNPDAQKGTSLMIYNNGRDLREVAGEMLGKTSLPLDQIKSSPEALSQ